MDHSYWKRQTPDKPLYPDIEWSKPEQKSRAGRLAIIGGNKLGFASVAEGYSTALASGVGEVRVILPDALKRTVPPSMTDVIFAPTNPSGGLSKQAANEITAASQWASGVLLIGDFGKNSETAMLIDNFIHEYAGQLTITRDAIDLVKNSSQFIVDRPNTLLVCSFAQLQKLFQNVYYPKVLTFSMQLTNLVEAVHKFTITYPITIAVFHKDQLIVASGGNVTTTPWENPMAIWKGEVATNAASYWLWNPDKQLESVTSSIV